MDHPLASWFNTVDHDPIAYGPSMMTPQDREEHIVYARRWHRYPSDKKDVFLKHAKIFDKKVYDLIQDRQGQVTSTATGSPIQYTLDATFLQLLDHCITIYVRTLRSLPCDRSFYGSVLPMVKTYQDFARFVETCVEHLHREGRLSSVQYNSLGAFYYGVLCTIVSPIERLRHLERILYEGLQGNLEASR